MLVRIHFSERRISSGGYNLFLKNKPQTTMLNIRYWNLRYSWNYRKYSSGHIVNQFYENIYRDIEKKEKKEKKEDMPALRFQTCRLLSGNVRNRELTIIQRRILRRLRNRGARLTEVLKQPQYTPLPIEKQILVIYAAVTRLSMLIFAVFLAYFFCLFLGITPDFAVLLKKAAISLGARAFNFTCVKVGLSGGLALAICLGMMAGEVGGHWMMSPSDDSSSAPSALEQRTDELIQENLRERKGDLADGQRVSEVRQGVETDFNIGQKADQFQLIKQLEKETKVTKPSPVTNCAFNEVSNHEGQIQDGKGGGKPTDCSKAKADE